MRRWMVSVAIALPLLTVTACGLVPGRPAAPVIPAGTVRVLTSTEPVMGYEIPGRQDVADLGLIGANGVLHVHQTAVMTEVGETAGDRWGLDGPVRASDGQELFWASLRVFSRPWTTEDAVEPEYRLVAGDVSVALGIPRISTTADAVLYTDAVLVSVPKGGPVLLRMTDDGVTQTLDLRAGKRGADARGRYPAPSQAQGIKEYEANGGAVSPLDGRPVKTDFTLATEGAVLVPWAPGEGRGWARKGRTWLRLNGVAVSGAIGPAIGYQVYTHRFFTVSTADGKRYPAVKASLDAEAFGGLETYGVYIDVPESFRAGTLHVDPVAGLRQADGDPIKWIVTPAGGSFPIKLAG